MVRRLGALLLLILLGSIAFGETYPKIDVTGFKKWEYRDAKVDPQSNYFLGVTHLGGFSPNVTGGPWQERLQLKILAQLNEKLSVSYDVQQQPESPDLYDVKVNYDNKHELTFGDFTANFSGNEFTTVSKYLNGMMITSKDEGYDFIAVPSAKLKSQVQGLTKQVGNNTKGPYSLGHGSIVEGSERLELNRVLLVRGVDYLIDYLEGKVTFTRILTTADEFTYSFEYTNLLDLFFPALSKKDFFGVQGRFKVDPTSWGKKAPEPTEVIASTSESFPTGGAGLPLSGQMITGTVEKIEITPAEQERLNELEFKSEQLKNNIRYLYSKVPSAQKDQKRLINLKKLIAEARKDYDATQKEIKKIAGKLEILATMEAVTQPRPAATPEAVMISQTQEEILEEESSGRYRLRHIPVNIFSETLTFRGQVLRKNEEYTIKYDEGLITLLLPVMPTASDPLTVSYTYPRTESTADIISGMGSRGPYSLSNQNLILRSEKVYVNDRLVIRDFDYYIDYDSGRLMFNYNVSNTSFIKARYRRRIFELPPPPPPPKYKPELTVGATYLRESAKKSVGAATADLVEAFTQSQLAANDNTIYLSHLPMLNQDELTQQAKSLILTRAGVTLVEGVDYAVPSAEVNPITGLVDVSPPALLAFINDRADRSDGYATSTIKMLTAGSGEVTVLYTYKKAIVGRYTAAGDGGRGPYYIKNYVNLVPGAEVVEVWDAGSPITTKYVRNSSFEANALDLGYSINYYKDTPYITFNKELPANKNFSVTFQYVPPTAPTGGDMAQDVTGFDADFKYGELLGFSGNFARSRTDQVIPQISTIEAVVITAPTTRITLNSPGTPTKVVEGSEKIYVNQYLRNRDIDYIIDYTQGVVSFYYITVTSADAVRAEYSYPDPSGAAFGQTEKADSAYKYSVVSKVGDISVAHNAKRIGFDFNPLGGTAIGVGSNYQDFSANLAPQKLWNFKTSLAYRETNNPFGTTQKTFTHNYDRDYNVGMNPLDLVALDFNMRNSEVLGDRADPTSTTGPYTADSTLNNYSLSAAPAGYKRGIFTYDQKYDGRRSLSENRLTLTKNNSDYFHTNQGMGITERVKLGWDYAISEPVTIVKATTEAETAHSLTRDNSYDLSVDLTFPRVQKWVTYVKLIDHVAETRLPTPNFLNTKNTTYHMDLTPMERFSTSADYNRQETPSVVTGGKNPLTERTATNVRATPIGTINTGWAYSEDHTVSDTGRESKGRSNNYTADWAPIQAEKVKFNTNFSYFYRTATTPLGTLESNTDTNTLTQNYDLTLTPLSQVSLTPGFTQENYLNVTDGAKLESTAQTSKLRVTFSPYSYLSSTGDYNLKVTSSAGQNRPKSTIGVRTGWRVDWGELVWNLDEEDNKGEVQAGGVIPSIDYKKTTNTFSLNFNIPQDNPVLSGVLLTASYKLVNFINNLRALDNFKANLLSFEGTLNF
ncbi:hypothetical protein HZC35_07285 [Candidatus Saganbacteria bacterium]|nr:hypothetical protein [Candidatus Saganbacteria bacterium]